MKDFPALTGKTERLTLTGHKEPSAGEVRTLDRRRAARAELDALLGQVKADQLLCSLARQEGDPVFDLALLDRALASASAVNDGRDPAFPRPPVDQQVKFSESPRDAEAQDASPAVPGDLLIEIPLPRSLVSHCVVGRDRHG